MVADLAARYMEEHVAVHRAKLHGTNPIGRLNGEIKRHTNVVGIFPNEGVIVRLVGALLLEQNDEWTVQRARYVTLETISQMSDDPIISLPAVARRSSRPKLEGTATGGIYTTSWDTIFGYDGLAKQEEFPRI